MRGAALWIGIIGVAWGQAFRIVSEEGEPIPGAYVRLQPISGGKNLILHTDTNGLASAPPGLYRIEVWASGFLPYQAVVQLPTETPLRLVRPTFQVSENVITGSYAPIQEQQSLYPVRILTAERLQAQGALYLPQVFTTELNTYLGQDPNLGSFAFIQGLGGQHVKVLIDGVPVPGRVSGSVDLAQLPLLEVERVEIVEGPMSVLYGTDAIGGVINVITRSSRCQWEGRAQFQYEGVGVYDVGLSLAGGSAKHRLFFSGGRYYFDGWDPDPKRPRAHLWRPREQYNLLAKYEGRPSERLSLRFQLPYSDETFFNLKEPTITPRRIYAIDEYYYTRRFLPATHITYRFSHRLRWDQQAAFLYYRRIRNVIYKDLLTLEETLVPLPGQQDSTQEYQIWARGGASWETEGMSVQLGHEIQHTILTGGRIREGRAEMGDYALWGTAEWQLHPKFALRPGFRWAHNTRYAAPFLPALHLRWEITPTLTWRIGYSRGFRAPSLREQFLYLVFTNHNIQGNPALRPEYSHHLHTNLSWSLLQKERLWRLRISAFYNDIRDIIQLVVIQPATLLTTYLNLQWFQTIGLQPRIEMRTQRISTLIGATFTLYRREQWGWETVAQTSYLWKGFTLSAFFKYQGRIPTFITDQRGTVAWRWIGEFPWMDISISRSFWQNQLDLVLGMRNLFHITNVQANLAGGIHTGDGLSTPIGMGRFPFVRISYHIQRGTL